MASAAGKHERWRMSMVEFLARWVVRARVVMEVEARR
jgi:hypothetical protein